MMKLMIGTVIGQRKVKILLCGFVFWAKTRNVKVKFRLLVIVYSELIVILAWRRLKCERSRSVKTEVHVVPEVLTPFSL